MVEATVEITGKNHDFYETTEYCLKEDAIDLIREWLDWLFTGEVEAEAFST